jgi:hypothetical protein
VIAELPPDRQARIAARYRALKHEVESLRALCKLVAKARADIAAALKVKQPSLSKIERQADMYLSALRSTVEAAGGELDLILRFPSRPALRIAGLGDILDAADRPVRRKAGRTSKRAAA